VEYRKLGESGLSVSAFCLGAMMFGPGANEDLADCERVVALSLDAGINFFDTADAYGRGESERILGRALKARREHALIATKLWWPMGRDPNQRGASRRWIVRACEDSLRRLGTDWIDLYQLHRIDPDTALDEQLDAMSDLVRQGKVRAIGTSSARAEQLVECVWTAERRNLVRIRSEQPPYSIFTRGIEAGVLPTCQRYGIGTLVWSPLNGGWLAGRYRRDAPPPPDSRAAKQFFDPRWWDRGREAVQRKFDLVEALEKLAAELGCSLSQLALAFCLAHPAVSSAIIGPRTSAQCAELLARADLRLDAETLDAIDALVPPGTNLDPTNLVEVGHHLDASARRRPQTPLRR
jgi:aryl-alcohol dehydrogenase (NADP+)